MNDRFDGQPGQQPRSNGNADQQQPVPRTRAEERSAALETDGATTLSARIDKLEDALAVAQAASDEAKAGWQRSQADFANFKRRTEQERAAQAGRAADALLLKVVAIADDFDLAIEHVPADAQESPWVEGVAAIDRKLRSLLEGEGMTPMVEEGQPFDPHEHQAVSYEESADVPDGTVLKVLQQGYRIRDRILRPALVAVARNDEPSTPTPDQHD